MEPKEGIRTIVPAANESPTTDPCQPIARIQPTSVFSRKRLINADSKRQDRTSNVAEIFLAPSRGELRDPVILYAVFGISIAVQRSWSCRNGIERTKVLLIANEFCNSSVMPKWEEERRDVRTASCGRGPNNHRRYK